MKRFNLLSHLAYAALLMLGCSLFAVSCKDDDNENGNGAGTEQVTDAKDSEQAMSLLGILKAVADVDTLPNHWTSATFEPTVGYVLDAAKPYVRSIAVENAKEAAAVYANLTDKDYNASLTSDSWSLEGVGSLTYKLENKSDVIATIDCQLKQVPHLTQLRTASIHLKLSQTPPAICSYLTARCITPRNSLSADAGYYNPGICQRLR